MEATRGDGYGTSILDMLLGERAYGHLVNLAIHQGKEEKGGGGKGYRYKLGELSPHELQPVEYRIGGTTLQSCGQHTTTSKLVDQNT